MISKILIIEDNKDLSKAYQLILNKVDRYKVVGAFFTCEDAFRNLDKLSPDLVLMDLELPGINGIEGIKQIRKTNSNIKIIVLTVHDDKRVLDALSAGAIGYITKKSNHHELIKAIDSALSGGSPLSDEITSLIVKSFHTNLDSPLTSRETEVLKKLAQGKTYNYISDELSITYETVKTHIKHIYWKLDVDNKSDAVIKARDKKYI